MSINQKKETETKMESTKPQLFSRQPLATLGIVTVGALLGCAVSTGALALIIGLPDNITLLILTVCLLVCAGLVTTGLRWIPLLATLFSGVFLYQALTEPFVNYHLAHPQTGGFLSFVLDVLIIAFLVVTLGVSAGATVQNYWRSQREAPRWLLAALTGVAGIVVGAVLIGAPAQPGTVAGTGPTAPAGEPTVHLGPNSFLQASVAVSKGSKLLLVDDGSYFHILANGSWENGTPRPGQEPGAPSVNNVQVTGKSLEIGPFTTAGSYHIYCTVHQGMNLTIIVR